MSESTALEAYKLKLASNPEGVLTYETLVVYHPLMTKTYYLVMGNQDLTAFLETGEEVTFEPSSMVATNGGNNNDTDQQGVFTLPDIGNILDDEMQNLPLSNTTMPTFTYRAYISTDLSYPCRGPIEYDLQDLTQSKGLFTANVGAPRLNERETGVRATPSNIPLMRGLLG